MKKWISAFMAMLLCIALSPAAIAAQPSYIVISETTEYFADGSSVTTTVSALTTRTRGAVYTTDGQKAYTYNNGSGAAWIFTVRGVFSVNAGSKATCIDSSYSFTRYNSDWNLAAANASKSASTATASGTVTGSHTVYPSVSVSCDANGNIY